MHQNTFLNPTCQKWLWPKCYFAMTTNLSFSFCMPHLKFMLTFLILFMMLFYHGGRATSLPLAPAIRGQGWTTTPTALPHFRHPYM